VVRVSEFKTSFKTVVDFLNMSTSLPTKFYASSQSTIFVFNRKQAESLNINWNMLSCIVHQRPTIFLNNIIINKKESIRVMFFHLGI